MKRILYFLMILCLSVQMAGAQTADFKKAVAKYKGIRTVTASVTKTTHRKAIKNDVVTKGKLQMKAPNEVSIVMEGGKDQLLMHGTDFTMVMKGKAHKTSSLKNPQFASFQTVFESILSGGEKDISNLKDLTITRQGATLVLTIKPEKKGRQLFTSFVLTIDAKNGSLRSLRMNERNENYTEYTFSGMVAG